MSMWNIQRAIYGELNGVISVPVYDFVPQDTEYPYVTIGEDTALAWDTNTETGLEATLTIHTWTRDRGRKATKEIQKEIYDILHRATFGVSGGDMVGIDFEFSETLLDPDGHTHHGIQRFRVFYDAG